MNSPAMESSRTTVGDWWQSRPSGLPETNLPGPKESYFNGPSVEHLAREYWGDGYESQKVCRVFVMRKRRPQPGSNLTNEDASCSIPLINKRTQTQMNDTPAIKPLGGETVLVVEDNALVRRMMTIVLRSNGFNVFETSTGFDALRLAQENSDQNIRLLLSDVGLPIMGGEELVERFRILRPETRVILTSGNAYAGKLNSNQSQE